MRAMESVVRGMRAGLVVLGIPFALAGCASSSNLVDLWRDPSVPAPHLASVVVVSMAPQQTMRRIWEDDFVEELGKHGVRATPSYRLFPGAVPDTDQVASALESEHIDGVITIHRLATETQRHFVPGYTTVRPYERYNPWTGIYHTHFMESRTPGYTETDRIVRYGVDVWDPRGDQGLLWSGVTETINPSSASDVHRELTNLIVPELTRTGVLGPPAP